MSFLSAHTHVESFLSASTLDSFIAKAKTLKREYLACTDLGFLHSSLKAYNATKKSGIKPILGLEFYFKDPTCSAVSGTKADRAKYFTATVYAEDQEAYQAICQLVSKADFQSIEIREEKQNLFTWKDLEFLSNYKTNIVLGGIHCMVGKAFLASDANVGLKVFQRLNSIFKDRISVAMICEPWEKKYASVVEISYFDNTHNSIMGTDLVSTDRARKIKAIDLVERPGHTKIVSFISNGVYFEVNKQFGKAKLHTGFLPLPCDVTLKINKYLKIIAEKYSVPVIVSDYAYYANKEDKAVQDLVLEGKDKIKSNCHMKTDREFEDYLSKVMLLNGEEIKKIKENTTQWAKKFDSFELKYEWRLADVGENPLKQVINIIKSNDRMKWDDPKYLARLKEEIDVIANNPKKNLLPYFLPIRDVLNYYKENGELTGPLRGSCGGSLLCYLMQITQINPFRYDLPFNRFFSLDRIMAGKLPDVDTDLGSRSLLVGEDGKSGYLFNKYGDKTAQISTRNTIRLKSAIKDVNRYINGKVEPAIEAFCKGLPSPPQGIPDKDFIWGFEDEDGNHTPGLIEIDENLKKYAEDRPKEWDIVSKSQGVTRSFGRHAAAFVLSDVPVNQVVPIKDGMITQYEMKEVEAAGLIKMDFLVVSQLKDIEICLKLIDKKNKENNTIGYFTHNGEKLYIWDLPEIPEVFKSVWNGNTETLFQINSTTMTPFVKKILPNSLYDLAIILALVRPGPLDFIDPNTGRSMAEEYVCRRNGESGVDISILGELVPETHGIFVFQEALTKVAKELAGFPGNEAEILRENMGKKKMSELIKMKPKFIEGAKKKTDEATAEEIWERMVTFGRYGFNLSHAVGYGHITYACMFLRHFYPLEWWSAVLSNAEQNEITGKFWRHVKDLVAAPDINLSGDTMVPDYKNNKIRSKLGIIRGMGENTIDPIVANRPYKDIQDFVNKGVAGRSLSHKLIHVGILDSLFSGNMSLEEKLKAYEDAVEIKAFADKKLKAEKEGKKFKATQPKEGLIPQEYVNLHPLKDASMKKQVLPTMPIDLFSLGNKYSKARDLRAEMPMVIDPVFEKSVFLIDGPKTEMLDKLDANQTKEDYYVAAMAYIIEVKEFSYQKNTKRALKITADFGNYICEKVMWPDYKTGELVYPKDIKRGAICTLFMRKKVNRSDEMHITNICVDYTP